MTTFEEIAAQRPRDIEEAIPAMQRALDWYHERNDHRAIFLRAYYIITINVHSALRARNPVFFDPSWIASLAGKFSTLYFQSLSTFERAPEAERAWKIAHRLSESGGSSIIQNLVLGLNAHINYDLAVGIYRNLLEHGDDRNHLLLPRRKFDHDQVNDILMASIPEITTTVARDYGGAIRLLDLALDRFDDLLAGTGLRYYRERVWWNAVSLLTTADEQEMGMVLEKMNQESGRLAELMDDGSPWSLPVRWADRLLRRRQFRRVDWTAAPETAAPLIPMGAAPAL